MNSAVEREHLGPSEQNFQCEILMRLRAGTRKLYSAFMVRNLALVQPSRETEGDDILRRKQRSMLKLLLKHPLFNQSTTEKHVDIQQKEWQTGSRVQGSLLEKMINLEHKSPDLGPCLHCRPPAKAG